MRLEFSNAKFDIAFSLRSTSFIKLSAVANRENFSITISFCTFEFIGESLWKSDFVPIVATTVCCWARVELIEAFVCR